MTNTPRRRGAALPALLAVAGLLLVAVAVVVFGTGRSGPRTFATPTESASTYAGSTASSAPAPVPAVAPVRNPAQPFEATALAVPSLRISAPVSQILSTGGQLVPPADPKQVGWWAGSQLPGSRAGSTVLVGHVDTAQDGPGALFTLRTIAPRAVVRLSAAGRTAVYQVDSLRYYPKTTGLPASLFTSTGSARLVLISCGGSFDRTALSYRDNVVAVAHLISSG